MVINPPAALPPTGPAGGALASTYPNPTLAPATLQTFLQLLVAGTVQLAYGSNATVTWTASAVNSAQTTITHNIGRIPAIVVCVYNGVSGGGLTVAAGFAISSKTATTFVVNGVTWGTAQPLNATANFDWLAIG
jgi:hypothetical protein